MSEHADLLFELGTEELPPVALKGLSAALYREFAAGLEKAKLAHGEIEPFATPRRMAIMVKDCALRQPDLELVRRGPAIQAAFDDEGKSTKAAKGFARSCGVDIAGLERIRNEKGEWLVYRLQQRGKPAAALLPEIAETALTRLPIPKRMRWGESDAQFVRPVHWLLFLHGAAIVPCTILDAVADRLTYGHRFHHPEPIEIGTPEEYAAKLESKGKVIAHFDHRREKIRAQVEQVAETHGGRAEIDQDLLDEVTALVEWPMPISASFEESFLQIPHEALILTMKKNQKYFHLLDANGCLMNHFVTIANIDSPTPEIIKEGNERVVRPRFSDAMFFWQQDGKVRLEERVDALRSVIFQQKLGTMYEKSERVAMLAAELAAIIGGDTELARRAAMLSRCDLTTDMVHEFPEMQGIMGRYQATRDGEAHELAQALDEFYMPRFSGDRLPQTRTGIAISLAERIDTLVGIFGIGQRPTGDKDPFALRRTALGALRIMRAHNLPFELKHMLQQAQESLTQRLTNDAVVQEVYDFLLERLKGIYRDEKVSADLFNAVAAVMPVSVTDFQRRISAVMAFEKLPEAEALAAANKRIGNILKKSGQAPPETVKPDLFEQDEERALYALITEKVAQISPLLSSFDYKTVLLTLAELRDHVDRFFDAVMVMSDNSQLRANRLALLHQLNSLFLGVADISRLRNYDRQYTKR